jgi:aminoglycoside 6'-N-acetyltransferase
MHDPTFRPLSRRDFPLLRAWLAEPHVARWWNHDASAAAVERDFGPSIDGADAAEILIARAQGREVGLLQRCRFADNPEYLEELAPLLAVPGAALSIDYFIGDPAALRRGIGTSMIRAAVAAIRRDHPAAPAIVVPVSAANVASWRVLERAGFRRVASGPLRPDNPVDGPAHFVYTIDLSPGPAACS